MNEKENPQRRHFSPWIAGVFVFLSLTILILLQTSNLWKDFSVETASDTLLLYALSSLNFVAFMIFGFIFLRSIIKLARERRTLQLGAKIKTRLLLYFAAISILPIVAMAGFSYLFMNRAIERWFTQIPENVVRKARDVQTQAVLDQSAKLRNTAAMLASVLADRTVQNADLDEIAAAGNLTRIEILSKDNQVTAYSAKPLDPQQQAELERTMEAARRGTDETILQDGEGFDAAVQEFADGRKLVIVPDLRPEQSVSRTVESSLQEFDRLKEKQATIRQIGLLTLGVLTFLLIFASSWTAFYIARGLTVPIKALAEGAEKIASGELSHRVNVFAEDELALLVATFNEMSQKLEENSAELSERRRYIETVLESLPTGVISLDRQNRVGTINRAASEMLGLAHASENPAIDNLVNDENWAVLNRLISRAYRVGHATEQTVLRRENVDASNPNSSFPAAITATELPGSGGVVLVFEDLSDLIAAQRASAWREVARRMAHEIKNPLTPIQLSAERIAKRFSAVEIGPDKSSATFRGTDTAAVVRDGTETILREVGSLKSMVDEFSRYARLPEATFERGNLNEIIRQVILLYQDRLGSVRLENDLGGDVPDSALDPEQLKRVFVNLIDNALEAIDEADADSTVILKTRFDSNRSRIVAEVADNGKGIAPGDFGKLFQPYFSTKVRGTGLGLAIVHRIIIEHGGSIRAVSNGGRGARFVIELPVGSV